MAQEPEEGWTSEVYVARVIDGDTIEVEMRRKFAVRLIHPDGIFDCPEKYTEKGKEVIDFLNDLLLPYLEERKVKLFIPAGKSNIKLMDINSFNRLLGEIWINGKRLTDVLIENNHGSIK